MKAKILLLFLAIFLIGCKQEPKKTQNNEQKISERVHLSENLQNIELQSGKFSYSLPKKNLPYKKVIVLNASLIGYITALEVENTLVGVSSPEYIYSEKIQKLIQEGKTQNVGNEQKYDVEKIIALHPDIVITNYISSFENVYNTLQTNGIQVIFLDEYLEQDPLEKSSYLKIFGKLLGKEQQAFQLYSQIVDNYTNTKNLAAKEQEKPNIISNEMYGSIWYMPGGRTAVARLINDAGGNYILKDNGEDKAVNMSFEEVFSISKNAKIWMNAGNHASKKNMLIANANYSKLKVFNHGKIYGITGRQKDKTNDFFESGVVRADWVLQDYVKIFHPHLLPKHDLIYMKEIQ